MDYEIPIIATKIEHATLIVDDAKSLEDAICFAKEMYAEDGYDFSSGSYADEITVDEDLAKEWNKD